MREFAKKNENSSRGGAQMNTQRSAEKNIVKQILRKSARKTKHSIT